MYHISILGCGWLGKPLGKALVQTGYGVKGSTTQYAKVAMLEDQGILPYVIRLAPPDKNSFGDFFDVDTVVISIPPRRKTGQSDTYLLQMEQVVEQLVAAAVKKVLFISSTSIYPSIDSIVQEHDADIHSHLYQAENLFKAQHSFVTTTVRFAGLVGPGRHPGRFLSGKKQLTGAENPVNVIHLYDCVEILKTIIVNGIWGETFNACADYHPSRKEFYTQATDALNLDRPEFLHDNGGVSKIISSEKLKNQLPYIFHFPDPMQMVY